jgi:hypothetical protein
MERTYVIFFVNFVSSCARYVHEEPMCTGYVPIKETLFTENKKNDKIARGVTI